MAWCRQATSHYLNQCWPRSPTPYGVTRPQCRIYASVDRVSIGSDNGLSPIWCQAIIWINAGILSIGPLGTNFNAILLKVQNFAFRKMHLKISSVEWRPFFSRGRWVKLSWDSWRLHWSHLKNYAWLIYNTLIVIVVLENIAIYLNFLIFLTLRLHRVVKYFFMQDKSFILHIQYHGCWWPNGSRSQGICSHHIDIIIPDYSSFLAASEGLNILTQCLRTYHTLANDLMPTLGVAQLSSCQLQILHVLRITAQCLQLGFVDGVLSGWEIIVDLGWYSPENAMV